jgi:hypothetical protein
VLYNIKEMRNDGLDTPFEKKENQSQMFNRNDLKMMMVEVYEKNKRDDDLETMVYLFFMEN